MRRLLHLLLALLVANTALAATVCAKNPESQLRARTARVASPGAAVRSGPGASYYLTDTLPEATDVEVYQQRPDGWCAIRPPAESFSWVFAQHVRVLGDGVAEIEKEDVASRVGSRLSSQRDVVQVRLRKGETVAILGRDDRDGGLWYKIAPPAGEFRWMRAQDLGLAEAGVAAGDDESFVRTAALEEPVAGSSSDVAAPPLATEKAAPPAPASNDQWTAAKSSPPTLDVTPVGPGAATSTDLDAQLRDLELRLSRMVAEPPATWNVAPLEQAAEQLLSRADTVADREAVKVTLGKIDRFATIQRRYGGMKVEATRSAGPPESSIESQNGLAALPNDRTTVASQYDAVGILRPVVSRRPGAPQFALVNDQGQVVTFISPAPDVNLQPYIGQRIGVSGRRGYIPEFRRAHVTAGRVSPLEERMLR